MTAFAPVTNTSDSSTVTASVGSLTGMVASKMYLFVSSTNCWIKQGTTQLVTCTTNANMTDGDKLIIAISGLDAVTFEYDKAANGVTAGNVSWAAGASTAAQVAATLVTAINGSAIASYLTVTDNTDGTVTITVKDRHATFTEQVAHVAFTVAATHPPASAADGSMFVPAGVVITIDGNRGPQLGVIRNSADGNASLTRAQKVA